VSLYTASKIVSDWHTLLMENVEARMCVSHIAEPARKIFNPVKNAGFSGSWRRQHRLRRFACTTFYNFL